MTKIKKILIFLSAIFLVILGNKKNADFTAKDSEKKNNEVLEQKKKPVTEEQKAEVISEPDGKEKATASK
jgi:hypothetical protein